MINDQFHTVLENSTNTVLLISSILYMKTALYYMLIYVVISCRTI